MLTDSGKCLRYLSLFVCFSVTVVIDFSEASYSVCESGGPIQVCSVVTSGESATPIPISISTITGTATSMFT